ncbi:hypothetical protein [Commensalibacter nepenthis]|uniref:Uncharacterized protein n=1 Tax=Commensalibacter nepenthis TaxID=3043872 RepID=A0ABT6QCF8_9PROT|nr:hypothetical protein [Commensalibacter sp. TBRC 10068]MDI2113973.1 hypothetical protein [Commensalibacter sp. TBRC 10068]
MKIKDSRNNIIDVVAIYWYKERTVFLSIPKNYGGLMVFNSNNVEIIDPVMNFRTIYFDNDMHGIYHWALIEEDLLDEVIDHDPKSFNRFIKILKSEGVLSEDFI